MSEIQDSVWKINSLISEYYNVIVTSEYVNSVSELVLQVIEEMSPVLEAFAYHAGRNEITDADVKLYFRTSPQIVAFLNTCYSVEEKNMDRDVEAVGNMDKVLEAEVNVDKDVNVKKRYRTKVNSDVETKRTVNKHVEIKRNINKYTETKRNKDVETKENVKKRLEAKRNVNKAAETKIYKETPKIPKPIAATLSRSWRKKAAMILSQIPKRTMFETTTQNLYENLSDYQKKQVKKIDLNKTYVKVPTPTMPEIDVLCPSSSKKYDETSFPKRILFQKSFRMKATRKNKSQMA